jgi:hypothetical protein
MKVYNAVILSASLFGSFYLFNNSLIAMNKKAMQSKISIGPYEIINGIILICSGYGIIYTVTKASKML